MVCGGYTYRTDEYRTDGYRTDGYRTGHNARMVKGMRYVPPASQCHYLADRMWQLEYVVVTSLKKDEFDQLVQRGWRRFGDMLFRPVCPACTACQPIRILVDEFKPDRNQRRVQKTNADTRLEIGPPSIDETRLDLYFRHHMHHSQQKGWEAPEEDRGRRHIQSIINGPLPVSEWAYYRDEKLVAISYTDDLADGFSGVYFYHDPEFRKLSLGTWICLSLIEEAQRRGLPFVYLGYYIDGCRSMEYKGSFAPNQVLDANGDWQAFRQ
jgi:arginyl-tRNA--protein-N-Asp/Glu arginylyltransferase